MDLKEYLNANLFPGQKRVIKDIASEFNMYANFRFDFKEFKPLRVWIDLQTTCPFDDYFREDIELVSGWSVYFEYERPKYYSSPTPTELTSTDVFFSRDFNKCVEAIRTSFVLEDVV